MLPSFRRINAFALAYFLLVSTLVIMLTGAVLMLGREGLRATRSGVDANRALLSAEAGMAELISRLEQDPSWTGSESEKPLPRGTGEYSYGFSPPSSADSTRCVNNLQGTVAVDSYRGSGTVPPHAALLVVKGHSGLSTRTVEALVVAGLNVEAGDAITATGEVRMEGDVRVDGRKSLVSGAPVVADLHTNSEESGIRVSYSPTLPGQDIEVAGRLTSSASGTESEVFSVGGTLPVSKLKTEVAPKNLPRPNIEVIVSDGASSPGPPIPVVAGEFRLSGKNHYGTDITVNGDLVLEDGTTLLVDGDLTVNGSISGRGQVVVTGDTRFYGDARVAFREQDYVSLLSKGHVELRGFRGQQYMEALAQANPLITRDLSSYGGYLGDPGALPMTDPLSPLYPASTSADTAWRNLNSALREIQTLINTAPDPDDGQALRGYLRDQDHRLDALSALVSFQTHGAAVVAPAGVHRDWVVARVGPDLTYDNAGLFTAMMRAEGGGPLSSTRFLEQRFEYLGDLFRRGQSRRDGSTLPDGPPGFLPSWAIFLDYENWDPTGGGLFDSMQSQPAENMVVGSTTVTGVHPLSDGARQGVLDIVQGVLQFEIDRLGSANFKGIVYTTGSFVATDDVVVSGTVFVHGDPTMGPATVGGRTYQPGDVGLFGYTTLTYVDEFFDDGVHNLAGSGSLDIKRWTAR